MRKKFLAAASVAGILAGAGGGLTNTPAQARCDAGGPTEPNEIVATLPTSETVYRGGGELPPSGTSGMLGLVGGQGYAEAGGNTGFPFAYAQGATSDGAVNGLLVVSPGGVLVCVNDTSVVVPPSGTGVPPLPVAPPPLPVAPPPLPV